MQKTGIEVQSLQRALDILEMVGNSAAPMRLKKIAAEVGLPKSTVYRLLSNLEGRGYVRCSGDGIYTLGLKLLMMSQRVEEGFELKHLVRPYLVKLNSVSKESVHLGMLENHRVLYVDTIDSPHIIRLVAKVGMTNELHCTALGKALLMGHPDEAIRRIMSETGMPARTAFTLTTPDCFLQEMLKIRSQGYAVEDRESNINCRCVSAPIYNHKGMIVAAISISGPDSRVSLEEIENGFAPVLLEATQSISRYLGLLIE